MLVLWRLREKESEAEQNSVAYYDQMTSTWPNTYVQQRIFTTVQPSVPGPDFDSVVAILSIANTGTGCAPLLPNTEYFFSFSNRHWILCTRKLHHIEGTCNYHVRNVKRRTCNLRVPAFCSSLQHLCKAPENTNRHRWFGTTTALRSSVGTVIFSRASQGVLPSVTDRTNPANALTRPTGVLGTPTNTRERDDGGLERPAARFFA